MRKWEMKKIEGKRNKRKGTRHSYPQLRELRCEMVEDKKIGVGPSGWGRPFGSGLHPLRKVKHVNLKISPDKK